MPEMYNPLASFSQSYNMLEGMSQDRTRRQAGQAFASGDYGGSANILGSRGLLGEAADMTRYGQQQQDRTTAFEEDGRKKKLGFLLNAAGALQRIPEAERKAAYASTIRPTLEQFGMAPELLTQIDGADMSDQALSAFVAALGQAPEKLNSIGVAGEDGAQDTILIDAQGNERKRFKGAVDPLARAYKTAQIGALEGRTEAVDAKAADKAEKVQNALEAQQYKAEALIGAVDDVLGKIGHGPGGFSGEAGFVGAQMSQVPGTKAYDVRESLETIKSNLGFQELAAMRQASPTGGALGAIAVQELKALQATVGNLDIGQSPEQLVRELSKIKTHYSNWLNAVQQSSQQPAAPAQAGGFDRSALEAEARRRGLIR